MSHTILVIPSPSQYQYGNPPISTSVGVPFSYQYQCGNPLPLSVPVWESPSPISTSVGIPLPYQYQYGNPLPYQYQCGNPPHPISTSMGIPLPCSQLVLYYCLTNVQLHQFYYNNIRTSKRFTSICSWRASVMSRTASQATT